MTVEMESYCGVLRVSLTVRHRHQHVESRCIQNVGLESYLSSGPNEQALAQVVSYVETVARF